MDQLKGSLRFIPLPAVTQFIAGLGSTGRLQVSLGAWSGEIALGNGQVVGAQLGAERGRPALDGMVLALTEADFAFVDGPAEVAGEPLLSREELASYMAGLVAERERLQPVVGMLNSVPCLVDQHTTGSETNQVTIQAAALQLIPALVYGHTLEQIARRRGLARTLREIAALRNGGLVRLEATPAAPPTLQAIPAAQAPARAPADQDTMRRPAPPRTMTPPTIRPLRPLPTEPRPAAQPPRRAGWWQTSSAAAPATLQTLRPRLVTEEPRPHLDAVRPEADHLDAERLDLPRSEPRRPEAEGSAPGSSEPGHSEPGRSELTQARGRSWRSTLLGMFVAESSPPQA